MRGIAFIVVVMLSTLLVAADTRAAGLPRLKVSDNRRFLVTADGAPFFYLGDTAWELFHRLNREEADFYLETRARQGFNVIQAVVLAELGGLVDPNPYGQLPLIDNDPARPNEKYFEHVDYIVNKAESLGLYIGMLPTWGDKVNKKWGMGPEIFTPENARIYGEFLGRRYKEKPIIWILGGDRPIEQDRHQAIFAAMAEGVRRGDGGNHLITYHTMGGQSSSKSLHHEPWLDFNMLQSGHGRKANPNYKMIAADYNLAPTKPCIDGEPNYENHPIDWKPEKGWFDEHDVRRAGYWAVFAGAMGHTYGCHDIWQFFQPGRQPISSARTPWREAINLPAAGQMRHLKMLMLSRPYLSRIPDQSLLPDDRGDSPDHLQANRSPDGAFAFVYTPAGKPFTVNLSKLSGERIRAWWYDPRTGEAEEIGAFERDGMKEFTPPAAGEQRDWVLVLDDASKQFPPPGRVAGE